MNDCRKCINNGICKQLEFMSPEGCFSFQENGLVRLPKIYIKDMATREIFLFGTDIHDSLYIDKQGNLQYINLHNGLSTGIKEEVGENKMDYPYRFVRYDDQDKKEITQEYLHQKELDKHISLYECYLNTIPQQLEPTFDSLEEKIEYYQAIKEECAKRIQLAQKEIDKGAKQDELH